MKRSKNVELNLNIEFSRVVLFKVLGLSTQFHAQEGGKEIIPSCLLIPSQLEKCIYKGETKIIPSRFLSRPCSHINSPLDYSSDIYNIK